MDFILKEYNELSRDELYKILNLRNQVFVVEQKCSYQDCDNKDQDSIHLMLMEEGKIIAYLRILNKGISYREVSIGRVLIVKEYRGKKLAKPLMLEAINYIVNIMEESEIRISAQTYLKRFYESLGFEPVSDEYFEDNLAHIEMFYKR